MNTKALFVVALALCLPLVAALPGCSRGSSADAATGRPPVAVEVVKLAAADRVDAIDVVGSLAPKFEAAVKPESSGTVEKVFVAQWVQVKKGQPLAQVDAREARVMVEKAKAGVESARAALLQAQVRARQAVREHERAVQLKENGLATQQQLDDAKSAREAAEAAVGASEGQLRLAQEDVRHAETRLDKTILRAPMDGIVSERNASPGDVVGEPGGGPIPFRVVDNRVLDLTVTVPAARMAGLAEGQVLEFTTEALGSRTFHGKVAFINPAVDAASRTVKVVAEVPNDDGTLKGGMFVRGRIVLGTRGGVLEAPRQALLSWNVEEKKGELFVVQGDVAHRRSVQTGAARGDAVEIAGGLAAGDVVVARGAFNVKDGDRVAVVKAQE